MLKLTCQLFGVCGWICLHTIIFILIKTSHCITNTNKINLGRVNTEEQITVQVHSLLEPVKLQNLACRLSQPALIIYLKRD